MATPFEAALDRATALRALRTLLIGIGMLGAATALVAFAESAPLAIPDASAIYLVAVVAVATLAGTVPALATAVAAVLVYDFLFVEPRLTLHVADPREWLNLCLFLFVGLAVGRLAARESERSRDADRRARESQALFAISRLLATAPGLAEAGGAIVGRLRPDTGMDRVWITLGPEGRERVVADTETSSPAPAAATVSTLVRTPGDAPARWVRAHGAGRTGATRGVALHRVRVEAETEARGWLWGARPRRAGPPSREETRLLALAADQIGLAARREQLTRDATDAEVARRSDALKSALMSAVSHDLRTPLASIRAAAGTLLDPDVEPTADRRRTAAGTIDAEADRLSRLVRNILDLTKIDAGALRPELEPHDLAGLVEPIVERLAPLLDGRVVDVRIADDLPPVVVDAAFFDGALTNLLENAARYAPSPAPIRVSAAARDGRVVVTVEDGGPGVPDASLGGLFERFVRLERRDAGRTGLGLGLSVVRGAVEGMGGSVEAGRSDLGGLAVRIVVPSAQLPDEEGLER